MKMMFKVLILMVVVAAVSASNRVNFRPCPGGHHVPNWVESDQCPGSICTVRRGQVFTARVHFTLLDTFHQLLVDVAASVFGINFPMSVPPGYENACNFMEGASNCPLFAGEDHVWAAQVPVDSSYPLVNNLVIQSKFNIKLENFR